MKGANDPAYLEIVYQRLIRKDVLQRGRCRDDAQFPIDDAMTSEILNYLMFGRYRIRQAV